MDARAVADLLDEFKKLPNRIERPQTFMEIAGYPHYENVCSNFLAFFLDPEGPHGMGSLFLGALLNSVGAEGGEEGFGGNVSVEREVVTEAGNRIDILLKTDSLAVLIENKIFASVANPFDDYAAYLDGLKDDAGGAYEKEKILLTLYPSGEGTKWEFKNVTHAAFASAVRSSLGHHVSEADTRYLTLMLDFLNTLEYLGEGTRMNQEFVKLLAERSDEIEKFMAGLKEFRDESRSKVRKLGALMDIEGSDNVHQYFWRPPAELYDVLVHHIFVNEGLNVGVDAFVYPWGWEVTIYTRKGTKRTVLEDLLKELRVPFEDDWRFIYPSRFNYDEDVNRIAPVVQELVEKLARSAG